MLAALAYSAAVSFALLKVIGLFAPLRAETREEGIGLDVLEHGEEAYGTGEGAILVTPLAVPSRPAASADEATTPAVAGGEA